MDNTKNNGRDLAEARGDFFFDELIMGQPDATAIYLRERLRALQEAAQTSTAPAGETED